MKYLLITMTTMILMGCTTKQLQNQEPKKQLSISLIEAINIGNYQIVEQHLKNESNLKVKDHWGRTILHKASGKEGKKNIVSLLIKYGAEVNITDKFGENPLHIAARLGLNDIAEILILNDIDINLKTNFPKTDPHTPLDIALEKSHQTTANLIRKHGGKTSEELKAEGK